MNIQHTVSSDFIIEALENFWDMRENNQPDWFSDARRSLKEQLFDMIEECGVGAESTPSIIIDNFLINGDFISRYSDACFWLDVYKLDDDLEESELEELWQEYCQENAIIYNSNYACLRF